MNKLIPIVSILSLLFLNSCKTASNQFVGVWQNPYGYLEFTKSNHLLASAETGKENSESPRDTVATYQYTDSTLQWNYTNNLKRVFRYEQSDSLADALLLTDIANNRELYMLRNDAKKTDIPDLSSKIIGEWEAIAAKQSTHVLVISTDSIYQYNSEGVLLQAYTYEITPQGLLSKFVFSEDAHEVKHSFVKIHNDILYLGGELPKRRRATALEKEPHSLEYTGTFDQFTLHRIPAFDELSLLCRKINATYEDEPSFANSFTPYLVSADAEYKRIGYPAEDSVEVEELLSSPEVETLRGSISYALSIAFPNRNLGSPLKWEGNRDLTFYEKETLLTGSDIRSLKVEIPFNWSEEVFITFYLKESAIESFHSYYQTHSGETIAFKVSDKLYRVMPVDKNNPKGQFTIMIENPDDKELSEIVKDLLSF